MVFLQKQKKTPKTSYGISGASNCQNSLEKKKKVGSLTFPDIKALLQL